MQKSKLKRAALLVLITAFALVCTAIAFDATHKSHYNKYWFGYWSYENGQINLPYYYEQQGSAYLGYRASLAGNGWKNFSYSPLNMYSTPYASLAKIKIYSKNYGNTGWLGQANRVTNNISINEYNLFNDWYPTSPRRCTYDCYTSDIGHEMGHLHGLDHSPDECGIEIMNAKHLGIHAGTSTTTSPYIGDQQGIYDIY